MSDPKYKVGDRVVVARKDDEYPYWLPDDMDKYLGQTAEVDRVVTLETLDGDVCVYWLSVDVGCVFAERWLDPAPEAKPEPEAPKKWRFRDFKMPE